MMEELFKRVRQASRSLTLISEEKINRLLLRLSDKIIENGDHLLDANKKDLVRMQDNDPKYDRLKLTQQRLNDIAADIRNVASLPSPTGITLEERTRDNGLHLKKVTVPLGVVGIIYEARPNVTFDVFALCLKSGNACILKGGSDAEFSNECIVKLIKQVVVESHLSADIIELLPSDRTATTALLNAVGYVDIIIPRGSQNLINFVRENARVPVIETGAGIVHTYFHDSGDLAKGREVIFNAKTRRVSVCNALDCLVIDRSRLSDLPSLTSRLEEKNVMIYADSLSYDALQPHYRNDLLDRAKDHHFGTEFLDFKMSIKTVENLDEALEHVDRFSSRHSEAIIAEDQEAAALFLKSVDAAAVYLNASTAFTDGAQFGLGAEIGISTQKLHARGPMALREMTSYKWIIYGDGTVRKP